LNDNKEKKSNVKILASYLLM